MNNIITTIVGLIVVFLAFKFLKGIIKFILILLVVLGVAYYLFF